MWRRSEDNEALSIEKDIFNYAAHIPAILNVETHQESRKSVLRTEWKLHGSVVNYIKKYLDFYSLVDLFTSRINAQFSRFVAYRPDPKAKVTNAFSVSWNNLLFYYFSPVTYIEKLLQKTLLSQNNQSNLGLPSYKTYYWQKHLSFQLMQIIYIY